MEADLREYSKSCRGCKISQGIDPGVNQRGGVIELEGDWIVNHYGGGEGFLGWLSLQPRFHRMELTDLTPSEAAALGGNLQHLDQALRQYWSHRFAHDPIQRVYVTYFHDTVFAAADSDPRRQEWHMHIHVIPRTVRLGRILRECSPYRLLRAWSIPDIVPKNEEDLPAEYWKTDQKMSALISYIRRYLQDGVRKR